MRESRLTGCKPATSGSGVVRSTPGPFNKFTHRGLNTKIVFKYTEIDGTQNYTVYNSVDTVYNSVDGSIISRSTLCMKPKSSMHTIPPKPQKWAEGNLRSTLSLNSKQC